MLGQSLPECALRLCQVLPSEIKGPERHVQLRRVAKARPGFLETLGHRVDLPWRPGRTGQDEERLEIARLPLEHVRRFGGGLIEPPGREIEGPEFDANIELLGVELCRLAEKRKCLCGLTEVEGGEPHLPDRDSIGLVDL